MGFLSLCVTVCAGTLVYTRNRRAYGTHHLAISFIHFGVCHLCLAQCVRCNTIICIRFVSFVSIHSIISVTLVRTTRISYSRENVHAHNSNSVVVLNFASRIRSLIEYTLSYSNLNSFNILLLNETEREYPQH